jgi:hypothetical protein
MFFGHGDPFLALLCSHPENLRKYLRYLWFRSLGQFLHSRSECMVWISRRFSELAVFYARLDIRVRRIDEPVERCSICGRSRSQLHMAHKLAGA